MERYVFDTLHIDNLEYFLKDSLKQIKLDFHVDKELLFWEHHFNGTDFTIYDNGHKKGGTLRFKEGFVRIPETNLLQVYETNEYKEQGPLRGSGGYHRGVVEIPRVVICRLDELHDEELERDGFNSMKEVLPSMLEYYPTIKDSSIVSFYYFGMLTRNGI